jgi:hypothetical protein
MPVMGGREFASCPDAIKLVEGAKAKNRAKIEICGAKGEIFIWSSPL